MIWRKKTCFAQHENSLKSVTTPVPSLSKIKRVVACSHQVFFHKSAAPKTIWFVSVEQHFQKIITQLHRQRPILRQRFPITYIVVDIPWMQRVCFANQGKVKAERGFGMFRTVFLATITQYVFVTEHVNLVWAAHEGTCQKKIHPG